MPVTPQPGLVTEIATGGDAVIVIPGGPNGGFITNPASASDQGLAQAETLYINPVNAATLQGNGTTFAIPPGGTWSIIPGQTTTTSVNAPTSSHKFSAVWF